MKTSFKFNQVINDAGKLAPTEGHTVLTSSPRVSPRGLLSFSKGEMSMFKNEEEFDKQHGKIQARTRSQKIKNTKRKNCIKRLREEAEHFLWRIKEVEKHNNCEEYNSILFEKSDYNKIEGAIPDLKKPLKLDGIIIGRHFVDGFRQLERSVRDEFRKVGG